MINSPVILKRKRLWIASDDRCSNSVLFVHACSIRNIACALQDSYAGHAGSDAGGALRELSPSEVGLWCIGWEIVRFQSQVKKYSIISQDGAVLLHFVYTSVIILSHSSLYCKLCIMHVFEVACFGSFHCGHVVRYKLNSDKTNGTFWEQVRFRSP